MKNFFWKKIVQEIRTRILCTIFFYDRMWKNMVEPARPRETI